RGTDGRIGECSPHVQLRGPTARKNLRSKHPVEKRSPKAPAALKWSPTSPPSCVLRFDLIACWHQCACLLDSIEGRGRGGGRSQRSVDFIVWREQELKGGAFGPRITSN